MHPCFPFSLKASRDPPCKVRLLHTFKIPARSASAVFAPGATTNQRRHRRWCRSLWATPPCPTPRPPSSHDRQSAQDKQILRHADILHKFARQRDDVGPVRGRFGHALHVAIGGLHQTQFANVARQRHLRGRNADRPQGFRQILLRVRMMRTDQFQNLVLAVALVRFLFISPGQRARLCQRLRDCLLGPSASRQCPAFRFLRPASRNEPYRR